MSLYYEPFFKQSASTQIAALIDPEKATIDFLEKIVAVGESCFLDWWFVGGSTVTKEQMDFTVNFLKSSSSIPVIIFPGHVDQIHNKADALLFMSLLSGRNPEYLIEQQIKAASILKYENLPVIPTAYLLVEGGKESTTAKVTNTSPIGDIELLENTAIAAQYMGMKALYLEAGSGAQKTLNPNWVSRIKNKVDMKMIVGGGISNEDDALILARTGADVLVIGNALEQNYLLLKAICSTVKNKI
jgi:phosphoglycerol geranylgeranyltransferase